MTDLASWLLEQIAADEEVARGTLWEGSGNAAEWTEVASATLSIGTEDIYTLDQTVNRHIATWAPARVLAESEAKRRIVELHETDKDGCCSYCLESESDIYGQTYVGAPCRNLRLLALPFVDRPGFRGEWRP